MLLAPELLGKTEMAKKYADLQITTENFLKLFDTIVEIESKVC
jgi:hypothetical protein